MILMLYLISTNVYNSLEAPSQRGFSYIEVWQLGVQFTISIAFCEYGFILYLKEGGPNSNLDVKIKKMDYATMIFSFIFFLLFGSFYWIILFIKSPK